MKYHRFAFAAALAPLALPVVFLTLKLADFGYLASDPSYVEKLKLELLILTMSSYAASFAFGVPVLMLLARIKRLEFGHIVVSALVCGVAAGLAFSMWATGRAAGEEFGARSLTFVCLACAASALINAVLFCLIAGIRRRSAR
jgi:hypothetical protein